VCMYMLSTYCGLPAERKGLGARRLNPHHLQKGKAQRVRHPRNRCEARFRFGENRKNSPPADSAYRSFCCPGKSVVQKLTDELKGLA
jgi:hypothetical protein